MKSTLSILLNISLFVVSGIAVGYAAQPKILKHTTSNSFNKKESNLIIETAPKDSFKTSSPLDTIPYPLKPNPNNSYLNNQSNENNLDFENPDVIEQNVTYDPESGMYIITETVAGQEIRPPLIMTEEEYLDFEGKKIEAEFWKKRANSDAVLEGKGLIPKMYVGGGLFNRLFGGSTVDIRPSGNLDLTVGYSWQNVQNLQLLERQRKTSNPDFDMNINLNVVGKIGEKLKLNTAYNTQATFNFENQIKLDFTGEEDQIIQKLEAGNVSMPLRSQLIQGSQTLFGFKTQLKFGKLSLTGLLSQQQSKQENIQIQGGAQTKNFSIYCDQYEDNKHFFIGQYFRNGDATGKDGFEWSLKNPPTLNSQFQIQRLEVWVTNTRNVTENTREAVAFTDLGESKPYNTTLTPSSMILPDNRSNNLFSNLVAQGDNTRDLGTVISTLTGPLNLVPVQDFEKSRMYKLSRQEYSYDERLGIISLNIQLKPAEILGVAYQYTYNGEVHQVGEFSQDVPSDSAGSKIIYLKMLKSSSIRTSLPIWDLMMKNIYSLGAYQVNKEDFRLDIVYNNPGGGFIRYLPEGIGLEGKPLISVLGLDKLNAQNDPQPDGVFDFYDYTIKTTNGRIMFPVLEPFGSDLKEKFSVSQPDLASKYSYDSLYRSTKARALQFPEKNRFIIRGTYKSSVSSEISLGAFNIPKNSIRITAGGQLLKENIDYTVDYNLGKVKILNEGILNSGVPINVGYEDPALIGFQIRTLLGARAEYNFNKNFYIGGTFMQLSERPFTQKVNIGDDPINNKIVGLDGSFSAETPFITRVLDKLPLYSTKEKSTINFSAEGAMFIPGHSKLINSNGNEGQVFLDDFEGAASEYDLRYPLTSWIPASTPFGAKDPFGQIMFPEANDIDSISYNMNRARTSWYTIDPIFLNNSNQTPDHLRENKEEQESPYVRQYQETDLFPNRQLAPGTQTTIASFDLSFFPRERGFYNYDYSRVNPDGTLQDPKDRWGGIMRGIDYNDFENANVQFIDFWMMDPFLLRQDTGDLYINLGSISEDVVKDSRQFFENALPPDQNPNKIESTNLGIVPKYPPVTNNFDNNPDSRPIQDVGFDGRNNELEKAQFQTNFLDPISSVVNPSVLSELTNDPCTDDFHHYRGEDYDAQKLGIVSRYKKFNGSESNSPLSSTNQDFINSSSQLPDIEDLNRDYSLNENEEYFQYRLHLEPNMQVGSNFITDKVSFIREHNGVNRDITFYHFRIPIQQYEQKVGGIEDFRSIRFMRMYLTGFSDSVTCRFARMDLIRNQWRNYEFSLLNPGEYIPLDVNDQTIFNMGAVNLEENSNRTPIPYVLPPGVQREFTVGAANTNLQQNEQSLSMKLCNLKDGDARAIFKTINLDLRQFKKLNMLVHAEELPGANSPLQDNEVTAFVRIGSDFVSNYYEYEIPLKVTLPNTSDPATIWPSANTFDFSLDSLTKVKLSRNGLNKPYFLPYTETTGNGNKITIIGNPDIGRATAIMIGIRNPKAEGNIGDDGLPKCAEVWINELKMEGFNEKGGYAAIARADIKLADLGTLNLSGTMHTQGFGALDQRLLNRFRDNLYTYDASAGLELGKFLPQKSLIRVPAYVGISQSFSNPEFDPFDSDIKLKDKVNQTRLLEGNQAADSVRNIAQTKSTIKSLNFTNVRKDRAPESKPHVYDIENFNLSYSYNQIERSTPDIEKDELTRQKGSIGYNFSNKPKFIQPFGKIINGDTKYFKWLREFNFYPLPTGMTFKMDLNRDFGTTQLRKLSEDPYPITPTFIKNFTVTRNYGLKFDLTKSIKIDYTATNQSRIDETPGPENYQQIFDTLAFTPLTEPWGRSTLFNHSANASYALPIDKLPFLDWVKIRTSYRTTFDWIGSARSPQALSLKNTINNTRSIQLNGDLDFKKVWDYIPFLKVYNKSQFPDNKSKKDKAGGKDEPKEDNPKKGGKDAKDEKDGKPEDKDDPKVKKKKVIVENPLLAVLIKPIISLKKVTFNYTENGGSSLPGFMYRPKFFGANTYENQAPPGFGYTFGQQNTNTYNDWLDNIAQRGWITEDQLLNNLYMQNQTNTVALKALFEPYYDLKIDVNFTRNYTKNHTQLFKFKDGEFQHLNPADNGNFSISYIGWNTLFEKAGEFYTSAAFTQFENNRSTIINRLEDLNPYYNIDTTGSRYGIYQQDVVIPAFIAAYTGKDAGGVNLNIFKILPKPNWRLTYNGLSKIPALKDIVQSINISHAYNSTLNVGSFFTNLNYKDTLNAVNYAYDSLNGNFFPLYNIPMVTLTEQLSPLIGVDVAFKKPRLTAKFQYKITRNIGLSLIDYQLIESRTKDLTLGMGYKRKNMKLPFIKHKGKPIILKNDVTFKFDFSIRDNNTINRKLDQDVSEPTRGTFTYRIAPSIDYMVNQNLNIRLFFDRSLNRPRTSASAPITNTRAGLTVRFALGQ